MHKVWSYVFLVYGVYLKYSEETCSFLFDGGGVAVWLFFFLLFLNVFLYMLLLSTEIS